VRGRLIVAGLPLIYVIAWFVVPVAIMTLQSFDYPTLDFNEYRTFTAGPAVFDGVKNSLELAAQSSLLAALLGSLLLGAMLSWGSRWRRIITLALLFPFVANELVRIVAWILILGPEGPIASALSTIFGSATPDLVKNRFGALTGIVHVELPFFVLAALPSVLAVDVTIRRAASSLGANRGQAFLTVFLPLALPGLLAAWVIAFVLGLGYYATPAALGGPQEETVLPVLITSDIHDTGNWNHAAALGVLLLGIAVLGLFVLARFGGLQVIYSSFFSGRKRPKPGLPAWIWSRICYSRPVAAISELILGTKLVVAGLRALHLILVLVILVYLAAPAIAAIPTSLTSGTLLALIPKSLSLHWYQVLLTDPDWSSAIVTSISVGIPSAIAATCLGLCAAVALVRRFARVGSTYFTVMLLPMIMPIEVTALGLFFVTVAIDQAFTERALIIAYTLLGLPYTVIVLTASLQSFDWEIDRAAQSLGSNWIRRLRDILVPLIRPAIVVSLLFAFITSFTELIFAFFMQTITLTTLPVQMWTGIRYDMNPATAAAAGVMLVVSSASFAGIGIMQLRPRRSRQRQLNPRLSPSQRPEPRPV